MNSLRCSTFFFFLSLVVCCAEPQLSLSDKGIEIDGGTLGQLIFEVPGLSLGDKDYKGEKAAAECKDGVVVAKYPSGAELQIKLTGKSSAAISFSNLPSQARSFVFVMHLPIRLGGGGKFALGKKAAILFPETKGKQIVGDGWAESLSVWDSSGTGIRLVMPGDYQQVQDNRVFNWDVFAYIYYFKFSSQQGKSSFTIKVEAVSDTSTGAVAAGKSPGDAKVASGSTFLIDRYGQRVAKEYPGKVKSDEELKKDGVRDLAEWAAYNLDSKQDSYGGLAGSGDRYKLKKTGFFHLENMEGRAVLVTPEGNLFFQLGVCGIARTDDFTRVGGREKIYEWLPEKSDRTFLSAWREDRPDWGIFSFYAANWIRKFGHPFSVEEWTGQAVKRLRQWGFNSAGAFSSDTESMRELNFPTVNFLPLNKGEGIELLPDRLGAAMLMDPFVPGTEQVLDTRFAKVIAKRAKDPLLIGYFYGNEQHFEDLPKKIAAYKASKVAAKGRLVQMLQDKYRDVAKFNAAWNPARPFADFDALKEEPLFIRTSAAAADMEEFYRLYLETYYSMVERLFRKYDSNHLLIGSRLTPGTSNNETAVRVSGKYTDVVSVNYYTYGIDTAFLKRVSAWSGGKPIILSEWYYSAPDTGLSGAKVKDQAERAKAYRNYVEQSAALPCVVGVQWFIYGDQSVTGRFFEGFNGEGNNTGLVDVADRPYALLVDAARETNGRIYDVMMGKQKPFAFDDPRFNGNTKGAANKGVAVPRALPGMKMDGSTSHWPGRPAEPIESNRLVFGNANEKLRGDFRLCWDEQNLYFLIQVKDPTPGMNTKQGDRLWNGDGVELFIGSDTKASGSMIFSDRQILIGAGKTPEVYIVDHADDSKLCPVVVIPEVSGDGYTLGVTLPWKALGIEPKSGMELSFDVSVDNSDDGEARQHQLMWNGNADNSKNRSVWGRATLQDN
jgi:hypothetical protein